MHEFRINLHINDFTSATIGKILRVCTGHAIQSRKHAYIIKTLIKKNPLLDSKTGVYRGIHYFSYFHSKHRLWVLVRTASPRRF